MCFHVLQTPVRSSAPSSPFASPPQTPSSTGGAGATAKRGGSSGISEHFTGTVSSRAGVRDADPVARVAPPSLDALTGGFKRAASLVTPPQSSKVKGEDTVDRDGPDETPTKRPAVAPSLPAAEAHSRPYTARFHG